MHYLDHIILGVSDLESGIRQFEELTGIRPARGGEHPELGTHNALVSLGEPAYLEILAPRPEAKTATWLQRLADRAKITPFMWVIGCEDIEETIRLLGDAGVVVGEPTPGSRAVGSDQTLRWKMAKPKDPVLAESMFFIEWDAESIHPSRTSPQGCRLESFEIATPEPAKLRSVLDTLGVSVNLYGGEVTVLELVLGSPSGRVRISSVTDYNADDRH